MPMISIEAVHPTKEQKKKLRGVGGKTLAQFMAENKK